MDISVINFWGKSRFWWVFMVVGILFVPLGFWIIISPEMGYEVISMLLGWALVTYGVVQLLISADSKQHKHSWGWWLAAGIIDIFLGFILLGNLILSELILPFVFAFVFLFKGANNVVSSISMRKEVRSWWLYMINGVLMLLISLVFFYMPYMSPYTILYLVALAFMYWGISIITFSIDLKPKKMELD